MFYCLYGIYLLTSALQSPHLAEVNLHRSSLSESGEAGCTFLVSLTLLYLAFNWDIRNNQGPVLPHLSKGNAVVSGAKQSNAPTEQSRNKWYNPFPVTIKRIDVNTVQAIYMTNLGTKCIFANWVGKH